MTPRTAADRAGLAALALAEGAPLPSAVGWDTTRDRCPAGCGGIATAWIEPLTGRTMEGCTRCDRAVVLTGRAAPERTVKGARHHLATMAAQGAAVATRSCGCGCGVLLVGRPAKARYASTKCAQRVRVKHTAPPRPCECGCGETVTNPDASVRYRSRDCANRHRSLLAALARRGAA